MQKSEAWLRAADAELINFVEYQKHRICIITERGFSVAEAIELLKLYSMARKSN